MVSNGYHWLVPNSYVFQFLAYCYFCLDHKQSCVSGDTRLLPSLRRQVVIVSHAHSIAFWLRKDMWLNSGQQDMRKTCCRLLAKLHWSNKCTFQRASSFLPHWTKCIRMRYLKLLQPSCAKAKYLGWRAETWKDLESMITLLIHWIWLLWSCLDPEFSIIQGKLLVL